MVYPLLSAPTVRPVVGTQVGIPADYGSLTAQGFTTVTTPGEVVEGLNLTDGLTISTGSSVPVIVRHNLANGASDGGAGPCIYVVPGSAAIIYENEITGDGYAVGVTGSGYIAYRNYLHDLPVDGFKAGRGAWIFRNLLEGTVWVGGDPHADAAQAENVIRDDLTVVTGNWFDNRYLDGEHRSSAGIFTNPNFDPDTGELGWFVAAGNTLAGGGYPIYAAVGDQGVRHFFFAWGNRIVKDSYEYAEPVLLGGGVDEPSHIVHGNELDDGTPITVETTRRGELSRSGGDLVFTYTAGETGSVTLGPIPAEFDDESEGPEPPMAMTAEYNTLVSDGAADAGAAAVTHIGLVDGSGAAVGSRASCSWTNDGAGRLDLSADLPISVSAGATVAGWRYYSASTGGTEYGGEDLVDDEGAPTTQTFSIDGTFIVQAAKTFIAHSVTA